MSVVYFDQLFVCCVIVYSDQLLVGSSYTVISYYDTCSITYTCHWIPILNLTHNKTVCIKSMTLKQTHFPRYIKRVNMFDYYYLRHYIYYILFANSLSNPMFITSNLVIFIISDQFYWKCILKLHQVSEHQWMLKHSLNIIHLYNLGNNLMSWRIIFGK